MEYSFGCLPPKKDIRDYHYSKAACAVELPDTFTVTHLPRIKNQGSVSSCVAHATSSILEHHTKREGATQKLSTAFIYGIQKQLCGYENKGMYLRNACKIVNTYGDMLEVDCPGNKEVPKAHSIAEEALKDNVKLNNAAAFKVLSYVKLKKPDEIKYALMNYGPVLASVKWFKTFKCKDGILTGQLSGDYTYHAIMIYGWNEMGFLAQNSWGTYWGDGGRFILPYEIPVAEAWQLVDADSDDIVKPVRNTFMDFIYKIINYFLNIFSK